MKATLLLSVLAIGVTPSFVQSVSGYSRNFGYPLTPEFRTRRRRSARPTMGISEAAQRVPRHRGVGGVASNGWPASDAASQST
jgi:hypothetical protein